MQINNYFERKVPTDSMSPVIYRALDLKTRLKPECVNRIAVKHMPCNYTGVKVLGVKDGQTHVRIGIEDMNTSSFALFLYQIMNWEETAIKISGDTYAHDRGRRTGYSA